MKHIYFYLILLLSCFSCQQQNPQGPAIISGNIEPGDLQNYKLILFSGQNITPIQADSTGTEFTIEFRADSVHFTNLVALTENDQLLWISPLYLTPGKKTNVNIDLSGRNTTDVFQESDPANQALYEYSHYQNEMRNGLYENPPQPEEFKDFTDRLGKHTRELAAKYQLPEEVMKYMEISDYVQTLEILSESEENEALFQQYLSRATEMLNNPIALQFANTLSFLFNGMNLIEKSPEEQILEVKKSVSHPIMQQAMTEYILYSYIYELEYGDDHEEVIAEIRRLGSELPDKGEKYVTEFTNKRFSAPGTPLPDVVLEDVHGNTCKLTDLKGKYLYIDLWASWCGPCCAEIPHLQKLEKQVTNPAVRFVSISTDTKKEAWKKKIEQYKLEGNQYIVTDKTLEEVLNIHGIPQFLLYDKEGKLMLYDAPRPSTGKPLEMMLNQLQ